MMTIGFPTSMGLSNRNPIGGGDLRLPSERCLASMNVLASMIHPTIGAARLAFRAGTIEWNAALPAFGWEDLLDHLPTNN